MALTNREMLVQGQLETTKAFENLDAILAVEGIDAYAWGSDDLAQSMGFPGQPDHPEVKEAERGSGRAHPRGGTQDVVRHLDGDQRPVPNRRRGAAISGRQPVVRTVQL